MAAPTQTISLLVPPCQRYNPTLLVASRRHVSTFQQFLRPRQKVAYHSTALMPRHVLHPSIPLAAATLAALMPLPQTTSSRSPPHYAARVRHTIRHTLPFAPLYVPYTAQFDFENPSQRRKRSSSILGARRKLTPHILRHCLYSGHLQQKGIWFSYGELITTQTKQQMTDRNKSVFFQIR